MEGLIFVPSLRILLLYDYKEFREDLYSLYFYGHSMIPVIGVSITGTFYTFY